MDRFCFAAYFLCGMRKGRDPHAGGATSENADPDDYVMVHASFWPSTASSCSAKACPRVFLLITAFRSRLSSHAPDVAYLADVLRLFSSDSFIVYQLRRIDSKPHATSAAPHTQNTLCCSTIIDKSLVAILTAHGKPRDCSGEAIWIDGTTQCR